MRNKILSACFPVLLLACQQNDGFDCSTEEPKRNNNAVTISQGLWGDVWFWQGDFMPVCASGSISPVQRTIYVYEQTTNDDVEQMVGSGGFFISIETSLIATTTSNSKGFFEVCLEPGIYSVFVREGDNLYANRWSANGVNTITVLEGQVTEMLFDITYEATN